MENIRKMRSYQQAFNVGSRLVNVERRNNPRKCFCVHFDLDSTLLNERRTFKHQGETYLTAIPAIVRLLQYCRQKKMRISLITARPSTSRGWTVRNLKLLNIPYDDLVFAMNKAHAKRNISSKHGCKFLLSVGDQPVDVQGGLKVAGVGLALNVA